MGICTILYVCSENASRLLVWCDSCSSKGRKPLTEAIHNSIYRSSHRLTINANKLTIK